MATVDGARWRHPEDSWRVRTTFALCTFEGVVLYLANESFLPKVLLIYCILGKSPVESSGIVSQGLPVTSVRICVVPTLLQQKVHRKPAHYVMICDIVGARGSKITNVGKFSRLYIIELYTFVIK